MTTIPDSLRELVESGPLAHVATTNPDGSPQLTVVWVGFDGDHLYSGHMHESVKVRNMRRDPRVVISMQGPRVRGRFLDEYAVLKVRATVTEGGAWDALDRLAKTYVGPDTTFPAPRAEGGFVVRYEVERIGGVGPWVAG
ncbi:PPOX class F420-dependent oxidoreductase [Terrabacter sp. 2RAF25]|uniref:PPOX class F420-dependent oxidoreductase n=1 Tax=Terrabacter sp. 2RAF25 TaxID=3232998 RepID=UPI003F9D06D2